MAFLVSEELQLKIDKGKDFETNYYRKAKDAIASSKLGVTVDEMGIIPVICDFAFDRGVCYELMGAVIHKGSADSGHFYCVCRDALNGTIFSLHVYVSLSLSLCMYCTCLDNFDFCMPKTKELGSKGKWVKFDDEKVKQVDFNYLETCFGGDERNDAVILVAFYRMLDVDFWKKFGVL